MAVTTVDSFLQLLEKSELVDGEQLARAHGLSADNGDAASFGRRLIQDGMITRWQAAQLLAGRSSFFLGKYKLLQLLGRGGMGSVFLAEQKTLNRRVALKIISKKLGQDPVRRKLFLTEARAIAALDHPNIVHAYNVDNEGSRYYIVMEYVKGRDLQRLIEEIGPLKIEAAADFIRQAAQGLAHAHDRGMIHCDIKPANLLLNDQGIIKILDMGTARLIDARGKVDADDNQAVLGTVDYLAPEQAIEGPELDHRVDIYSLGCTFYFLLTGHPPFPEGSLHERILKHQTAEPPAIADARPGLPEALTQICQRMMAKEPEARYQSAKEICQLLDEWSPPEPEIPRAVRLDDDDESIEAEIEEPAEVEDSIAGAFEIRVDEPSFSQRAGRKSAKKSKAVADENKAIVVPADEDVELEPAEITGRVALALARGKGLLGNRRVLLIAGGAAACFLLLGGIVGGAFWLGRASVPDQPELAKASPTETPSPGAEKGEPKKPAAAPAEDIRAVSGSLDMSQLLDDLIPTKESDPASGASEEVDPKPDEGGPDAKAADKPASEGSEKPGSDDADSNSSQPNNRQNGPANAAKVGDNMEESEKPEEEKKPPKPKDPFWQFASAVDLPDLQSSGNAPEPTLLTRINTGANVDWRVDLFGGEEVLKGSRRFEVKKDGANPSKAVWAVQLVSTVANATERTAVAQIFREGTSLKLRWDSNAVAITANLLRYCVLYVQAEGKGRYLQLKKPLEVDPIVVDLFSQSTTLSLPLKWLPESDKLRAEATGIEGCMIEPEGPVPLGTPIRFLYAREDRHGNTPDGVEFRLGFLSRGTSLTGKFDMLQPNAKDFLAFRGQDLVRFTLALKQQAEALSRRSKMPGGRPKGRPKGGGGDKKLLEAQLDQAEQVLWYAGFFEAVQQKATIHYRVFYEVDGYEVVLARTRADE